MCGEENREEENKKKEQEEKKKEGLQHSSMRVGSLILSLMGLDMTQCAKTEVERGNGGQHVIKLLLIWVNHSGKLRCAVQIGSRQPYFTSNGLL